MVRSQGWLQLEHHGPTTAIEHSLTIVYGTYWWRPEPYSPAHNSPSIHFRLNADREGMKLAGLFTSSQTSVLGPSLQFLHRGSTEQSVLHNLHWKDNETGPLLKTISYKCFKRNVHRTQAGGRYPQPWPCGPLCNSENHGSQTGSDQYGCCLAILRIPIFPKRNKVHLRQTHAICFLLTLDLVQTTKLPYMLRCYSENIPCPYKDWMELKREVRHRHVQECDSECVSVRTCAHIHRVLEVHACSPSCSAGWGKEITWTQEKTQWDQSQKYLTDLQIHAHIYFLCKKAVSK